MGVTDDFENASKALPGVAMKIRVETEKCCGHARCASVAPEVYILSDTGYLSTPEILVPDGLVIQARRGARACPERCIVIENETLGRVSGAAYSR